MWSKRPYFYCWLWRKATALILLHVPLDCVPGVSQSTGLGWIPLANVCRLPCSFWFVPPDARWAQPSSRRSKAHVWSPRQHVKSPLWQCPGPSPDPICSPVVPLLWDASEFCSAASADPGLYLSELKISVEAEEAICEGSDVPAVGLAPIPKPPVPAALGKLLWRERKLVCACICVCVCVYIRSINLCTDFNLDAWTRGRVVLECSGETIPSSGHGSSPPKCIGRRAASLGWCLSWRERNCCPVCWQSDCMPLPITGICLSIPGSDSSFSWSLSYHFHLFVFPTAYHGLSNKPNVLIYFLCAYSDNKKEMFVLSGLGVVSEEQWPAEGADTGSHACYLTLSSALTVLSQESCCSSGPMAWGGLEAGHATYVDTWRGNYCMRCSGRKIITR